MNAIQSWQLFAFLIALGSFRHQFCAEWSRRVTRRGGERRQARAKKRFFRVVSSGFDLMKWFFHVQLEILPARRHRVFRGESEKISVGEFSVPFFFWGRQQTHPLCVYLICDFRKTDVKREEKKISRTHTHRHGTASLNQHAHHFQFIIIWLNFTSHSREGSIHVTIFTLHAPLRRQGPGARWENSFLPVGGEGGGKSLQKLN